MGAKRFNPSRSVLDRSDNPYPLGSTEQKVWERAKRERFDITEAQIEFVLGLSRPPL
jgi:hypothetical protein